MDCLIFSVALLVVKRLACFPVHCVIHLGDVCFYIFKIDIQSYYRVIHRLVFISALLVMASMMMVPMVRVGVQTRRQEDASLEGENKYEAAKPVLKKTIAAMSCNIVT